ncbi:MAG: hypothetical protein IPN38_12295 [Flavobacteriales bacterium]|nr:hypothetical protein [Flavobacteriales bacterium]
MHILHKDPCVGVGPVARTAAVELGFPNAKRVNNTVTKDASAATNTY